MTTQRIFTTLFILIIGLSTSFGTERRDSTSLPIFRGILSGMYLHTGYVGSRQFTFTHNGTEYKGRLQGAVYGIGGHAKALLGRHIRIGGEAYISNHRYENGSKASILWGKLIEQERADEVGQHGLRQRVFDQQASRAWLWYNS